MTDDRIWVLLSLYLTHQATEEQTRTVLEWRDMSFENKNIMEQMHLIMKKAALPQFDNIKAFKKLDKKISRL